MKRLRSSIAVALLLPSAITCNNDTTADIAGCDGGNPMVAADCSLSISLMGSIAGTFASFSSCGSSRRSLSWTDFEGSGLGIGVTFMGDAAPVDQLGTFQLQTLDVSRVTTTGTLRWTTPPGTCSVMIEGSTCSPTTAFRQRRVIDGKGTCSQPATAQPGNTEAPVAIGDFTFVGFINPI